MLKNANPSDGYAGGKADCVLGCCGGKRPCYATGVKEGISIFLHLGEGKCKERGGDTYMLGGLMINLIVVADVLSSAGSRCTLSGL